MDSNHIDKNENIKNKKKNNSLIIIIVLSIFGMVLVGFMIYKIVSSNKINNNLDLISIYHESEVLNLEPDGEELYALKKDGTKIKLTKAVSWNVIYAYSDNKLYIYDHETAKYDSVGYINLNNKQQNYEYVELFKPESEIYSMAIANNTIYYNLKTDLSKIYNFNIKTKKTEGTLNINKKVKLDTISNDYIGYTINDEKDEENYLEKDSICTIRNIKNNKETEIPTCSKIEFIYGNKIIYSKKFVIEAEDYIVSGKVYYEYDLLTKTSKQITDAIILPYEGAENTIIPVKDYYVYANKYILYESKDEIKEIYETNHEEGEILEIAPISEDTINMYIDIYGPDSVLDTTNFNLNTLKTEKINNNLIPRSIIYIKQKN